jgi:DNA mismatch repair protein MSH6
MDEPKVRPEIVESDAAFIDFVDLRHPCMSLRTDFIANDIKLGGDLARQVLLTGPSKPSNLGLHANTRCSSI